MELRFVKTLILIILTTEIGAISNYGMRSGQYNSKTQYGSSQSQYSPSQYSSSQYSSSWNTLSTTWCSDPKKYPYCFQHMPMTKQEAEKLGWYSISKDCFNHGRYDGFIYIIDGDYSMALIYNIYGNLVGIQTNMLKNELTHCQNYDYKYNFDRVPYFLLNNYKGRQYYTLTAYFVDPKSICFRYNIPYQRNYLTELGKGIWLQNGDTSLSTEFIPPFRPMAVKKYWDNAQCVDSMGYHNFKNMNKWSSNNCATIPPWSPLYDHYGRNNVLAFMAFGNATSSKHRYEHLPADTVQTVMNGEICPKCVKPFIEKCGLTTMHVYFSRDPQKFKCPSKESENY